MNAGAREALALADWRRRVAELHLDVARPDAGAVAEFRRRREELFATHPASPLSAAQLERFEGLPHFDHDPEARVECELRAPGSSERLEIDTGGPDGIVRFTPVGRLATPWGDLTLLWTEGYGGGLFLPFRDATAPAETYGGGRYLTDTIKGTFGGGVELDSTGVGGSPTRVTLDFNYAYNPSCAYGARWACPLAPPENRLDRPIRAGELTYPDPG